MAEKPEKQVEETGAEETAPKAKSPLMKYIMMGGGGLLVVLLVAVGTAFLMGSGSHEEPVEEPAAETASMTQPEQNHAETASEAGAGHGQVPAVAQLPEPLQEHSQHTEAAPDEHHYAAEEDIFSTEDPSVLENIMDNLAFLDYQPGQEETAAGEAPMSKDDSLEKVDWLAAEKATLTEREGNLARRERELASVQTEISKKLLVLEQAEATRINNIAKLYDGMDQRAVAQLMANLDDNTVVLILPRMKTKNASAVMSLLPPKRAAKLSKQMITIAEH